MIPYRLIGAAAAVIAVLIGTYALGRHHASAAWEQRWEAREAQIQAATVAAQAVAAEVLARQTAATRDAAARYAHEQTETSRLAGVNRDLDRRLRDALRRAAVPAACTDPAGSEPAAAGVDAAAVAGDLSALALRCAEQHDRLAGQVAGLIAAWPR